MIYYFPLNDIHICNFADDTAAYAWDVNPEKLEENPELVMAWFEKTAWN